jgi:hypothetical protein
MSKILDAKYQKADLKNIAKITKGLTEDQKIQLWHFLNKYENLFDGTLGNWKGADYRIEHLGGGPPRKMIRVKQLQFQQNCFDA